MQVARAITTSVTAAALAFSMLASAIPANAAVPGFHASYFSESAFLFAKVGDTVQFAVGFFNNGDQGWVKGSSASQASLHTNAPFDNTTDFNAGWASNWKAPNVYAAQSSDLVAPGQVGYFIYNVIVPSLAALGVHHFYGRVAIDGVGPMEDWGYFQDVNVQTAPASTAGPSVTGCSGVNAVTITCTFSTAMSTDGTTDINDEGHYALSGGLGIGGASASSDATGVTLYLTCSDTLVTTPSTPSGTDANPALFNGLGPGTGCNNTSVMVNSGTYTVTVTGVASAAGALIGTSNQASFTLQDQSLPTVKMAQPGTYSISLDFSKPVDATSVNPSYNGITTAANNIKWDSAAFPGTVRITSLRGAENCYPCNNHVLLSFRSGALPAAGTHTLDVKDVKDQLGNVLSPNPTSFTVTITNDTTAPTATVKLASDSTCGQRSLCLSGTTVNTTTGSSLRRSRLQVDYSESMSYVDNGFGATASLDNTVASGALCATSTVVTSKSNGKKACSFVKNPGSMYVLRNPDGSIATTGGASGSGSQIQQTTVGTYTDGTAPANGGAPVTISTGREQVSFARFDLKRAILNLPAHIKASVAYALEINGTQDQAGNAISPNPTITTLTWAGDTTPPTVKSVIVTPTTIGINYSEDMSAGFDGFGNSDTHVCAVASYTAGAGTSNATTLQNWINTWQTGSTNGPTTGFDGDSCLFTATTSLASGTYTIQISATGSVIFDDFGNVLSPNPTNVTFTVVQPNAPTLNSATWISSSQLSVTYGSAMTGGVNVSNSAGNTANYAINNGTFGTLCTAGTPTITSDATGTVWTITCTKSDGTAGTGLWAPAGAGTIQVQNVADTFGNVINPNPSSATFNSPLTAGAASAIKVTPSTQNPTAGVQYTVGVQYIDSVGNAAATPSGTITYTIAGAVVLAASPAGSTATFGGQTMLTNGTLAGCSSTNCRGSAVAVFSANAGTGTITVTDSNGLTGTSPNIIVSTGTATALIVTVTALTDTGFTASHLTAPTSSAAPTTTYTISANPLGTITAVSTSTNSAIANTAYGNQLQLVDQFGNNITSTGAQGFTEQMTNSCGATATNRTPNLQTLTSDSGTATTSCGTTSSSSNTVTNSTGTTGLGRLKYTSGSALAAPAPDVIKIVLASNTGIVNTVTTGNY